MEDLYGVRGTYSFRGKEHDFSGTLCVDQEGRVSGEIVNSALLDSEHPRHEIQGRVSPLEGDVVLEFLQTPVGPFAKTFLPLNFRMQKQKGQNLSGDYEGTWKVVNPKECGRWALSYKSGIVHEFMVRGAYETENKARMNLTSKQ